MASTGQPATLRRWTALSAVCAGATITTTDLGMITIGFPARGTALGADLSTVVWIGIGYFLMSAGLLFFMGWLGWPALFYARIPLTIAAALLAWKALPATRGRRRPCPSCKGQESPPG